MADETRDEDFFVDNTEPESELDSQPTVDEDSWDESEARSDDQDNSPDLDDPASVETNVDEDGTTNEDFDQKDVRVDKPQADATIDGVNRVVDVVAHHRDPTKSYPAPTTRDKAEEDNDPKPEDGAELTAWLARKNPAYAVEPDKQDRAEAYLAKRLGLVEDEQEYLERVVGTPRTGSSPLRDSASNDLS